MLLYARMKREDEMPPEGSPRETYVTDNNDESTTRHENAKHMSPNLIEFRQEGLVVLDGPQLPVSSWVRLQRPVRRRCYDQMHRRRRNDLKISGVPDYQFVTGRNLACRPLHQVHEMPGFRNGG